VASLVASSVERVLARADVPARRRERARAAILRERLGARRISGCWILRPRPGASIGRHAREDGARGLVARLLAVHAGQYLLWIGAWWMIGAGALSGRVDRGWLVGWTLALATAVPLRALAAWWQGRLGIGAGVFLKRRLLDGALRLHPDELRPQGAGQLLGRVIESDAVESLAVSGGFLALLGLVELAISIPVLAGGAGGWAHVGLLVGWLIVVAALLLRYRSIRSRWTEARLEMTHDLVERMVGYRTRLAQEERARWHDDEEERLDRYLHLSARMDRAAARLAALAGRGWLVIGLAGLAPAFIWNRAGASSLAIGLGGVLLAWQSLARLAPALAQLADAGIAWARVGELFRAARRTESPGAWDASIDRDRSANGDQSADSDRSADDRRLVDVDRSVDRHRSMADDNRSADGHRSIPDEDRPADDDLSTDGNRSADFDRLTDEHRWPEDEPVLEAAGVAFRHGGRGAPVFEGLNLRIGRGDRVLLEGPSGAGKSTLASLLAGLREPEAGSLLLGGLDRWTVGAAEWRRRVAAAPQFHENHVLTGTFAFNLLMGRSWPATERDLADAEAVCRELGLGELLERMPSGLQQMVGEGGWQLSHGERSRLFIARALLQRGQVLVLDESFAALDPESLARALRAVIARAPALVVIAHP
jgi:ATP-binding cassette, subfamily B, bacterial